MEAGIEKPAVLNRHVEAVRDRRRQPGEEVLALAEERRPGRAQDEAVLVGEVGVHGERRRRRLLDGRVDQLHHRQSVRIPGRDVGGRRIRVADGHRRGVPHLGQPQRRRGEHLADLHRRHLRRPVNGPLPAHGVFDICDLGHAGVRHVHAREPRDRRAHGGLRHERREVEPGLHRIAVFGVGDAVAPRPESVLAVLVDDGVVLEVEGRHGRVEGRLASGEASDRRRRQKRVADDVDAGHLGILGRRLRHRVGLHHALSVLGVHYQHERTRGVFSI